jgi:hypothetical protein
VPPLDSTVVDYGVVDISTLRLYTFYSLHSPFARWQDLAFALTKLAEGDGRSFLNHAKQLAFPPTPPCTEDSEFCYGPEVNDAILCNDGTPISDTLKDMKTHHERLGHLSIFGNLWGKVRDTCSWVLD